MHVTHALHTSSSDRSDHKHSDAEGASDTCTLMPEVPQHTRVVFYWQAFPAGIDILTGAAVPSAWPGCIEGQQ